MKNDPLLGRTWPLPSSDSNPFPRKISNHPARQYEPEIFPGLVYRMLQPKVVILTFVNGKVVITGAKV